MAMYSKQAQLTSKILGRKALDLLLPPCCAVCAQPATRVDAICHDCWESLGVLIDPKCEFCGMEVMGASAPICAQCYEHGRSWDFGTSVVRYEGTGRKMVLRLKNMRAEGLAELMAKLAFEMAGDIFEEVDMIIPIPLHWSKFLKRGFNQAALFGYHLSRLSNVPMEEKVLKRPRATRAQTQFREFEGRFGNLENAFRLNNPDRVEGKQICLVDDVFTSGASMENAANALRNANPKSIAVFAFARAGED